MKNFGGIETHYVEECNFLVNNGHSVVAVTNQNVLDRFNGHLYPQGTTPCYIFCGAY